MITDLTNTTWLIPAGWTVRAGQFQYPNLWCIINDIELASTPQFGYGEWNSDDFPLADNKISGWSSAGNPVTFTNDTELIFKITGGGDATNQVLLEWFEANGKLQVEVASAATITYNGNVIASLEAGKTATLPCKGKKMKGDIVVTAPIVKDSPLPIEVATEADMTALLESGEVGGVYKYTGTTGTYENGALYVLEEEQAKGYTVEINLTNPSSTSYFQSCVVYDNYEQNEYGSYVASGNEIGRITSSTGSTTVVTSTGKLHIRAESSGTARLYGNITTTGGVTEGEINMSGCDYPFNIIGDGTITIDGIDWDD